MGKLTVRGVAALSAPGRYSDGDGSGFHLLIDANGRKYWVLRLHTGGGRRRDINIGSVQRMTLSAARAAARQRRAEIEAGGDAARHGVPTFARAAELAHQVRTQGYRNAKHIAQWINTLNAYAVPLIGEKPVDHIGRADVVAVLAPIWLEKPETARRVLQRIDRVMRWAVGHGHRDERIDMTLVRDALPRQPRRRQSVQRMKSLAWQDVPAFVRDLGNSASAPAVRLALELLVLTAVRPGNIRTMQRAHVVGNVWVIPGELMKGGDEHRVPLAPRAVEIIEAAGRLHNHDLLFTMSGAPFSADTLRMAMRRLDLTATPHGFRSSFKEWALAAGWADHLSESALAHVDPNEVRAAYARSDLLDERRPMMVAWAAYLAAPPQTPAETAPGSACDCPV